MTVTATAIKERPILFSTPMVQAILEGKKLQTRRILKVQPTPDHCGGTWGLKLDGSDEKVWLWNVKPVEGDTVGKVDPVKCPYGQLGDRLWVRESFAYGAGIEPYGKEYIYKADLVGNNVATTGYRFSFDEDKLDRVRFKPSIHMPRDASRLLLEITNIRVERLQAISEEDSIAEGLSHVGYTRLMNYKLYSVNPNANPNNHYGDTNEGTYDTAKACFAHLWQSINGEESWYANPWVWVVEFKVVEPCHK